MFSGVKQGSAMGNVRLAGVRLSVLGKGCVGPEVDVVVGMEYPGAALRFEGHHHQLHQVGWERGRQRDAVVLLDQSCPGQAHVGVAVVRLAIDFAAFLDRAGNYVRTHGQMG